MSFLGRIASRAAGAVTPGKGPAILRPKGLAGAWPQGAGPISPLRRQEEEEQAQARRRQEEEEEAQPLRRQEEEKEEAQALRRQAEEEEEAQPLRRQEEEEEEAQALRRQEEEEEQEEAQALRRQEEEEEAQPLRRQEEEEEEAQALRRQEEEEEEAQPLRRQEEEEEEAQALRRQQEEEEEAQALRQMDDDPSRLDAENSPRPDELSGEPEPPTALAIRRRETGAAVGEATTAAPGPLPGEGHQPGAFDFGVPSAVGDIYRPEAGFEPSAQSFERPSVTIDQLDVVIHEPAPVRPGVSPMQARSHAVRARLLRRL